MTEIISLAQHTFYWRDANTTLACWPGAYTSVTSHFFIDIDESILLVFSTHILF